MCLNSYLKGSNASLFLVYMCVCVWKKEYTQVHTGVGEIVSAVPTIDSKRNAHI